MCWPLYRALQSMNLFLCVSDLHKSKQQELQQEIYTIDHSGSLWPWCCKWLINNWTKYRNPVQIFAFPAHAYVPYITKLLQGGLNGNEKGQKSPTLSTKNKSPRTALKSKSKSLIHLFGYKRHNNRPKGLRPTIAISLVKPIVLFRLSPLCLAKEKIWGLSFD